MRPWLRLLERIHDLPIEQLDQHMARTLADELGVPYQPVRHHPGGQAFRSTIVLPILHPA
jgi:hypothetical protein